MAKPAPPEPAPVGGTPFFREALILGGFSAVIGIAAGFLAIFVRWLIAGTTNLFYHGTFSVAPTTPAVGPVSWWVWLVPAVGGTLAVALSYAITKEKRIRGVSDIVESIAHRQGRSRMRGLLTNAFSTSLSVGSGGSAGREGAIVGFGAAVAVLGARIAGLSTRQRKILIGAGAAGAIAGTFNTPIAGIVFAIEVVLLEFTTRSFVPLAISSVAATLVTRHFLGNQPSFPVPPYELVSSFELPLYVLLGLFCGLAVIALLRTLSMSDRLFARLPVPWWTKPIIGGLAVGAVGFMAPQALGVGYDTVEQALIGDLFLTTLVLLVLLKIVAFAFTRGSGGASGAFSPSLFIGAMLGGAFGLAAHRYFPTWTATSGAYALVGMAAVYAATTRASLTAIIMLFEMTHNFDIVLPLVLCVVVADVLAKSYGGVTVYSMKDRAIATDLSVNVLDRVVVEEIMSQEVATVHDTDTIREVIMRRVETGHQGFPVINEDGDLVGVITATDLRTKVQDGELDKPVTHAMTRAPVIVTPGDTAHMALTKMVRHDIGHLPVVDAADPSRLIGFLTRQDVIGVERRALEEEAPSAETFPERMMPFKGRAGRP